MFTDSKGHEDKLLECFDYAQLTQFDQDLRTVKPFFVLNLKLAAKKDIYAQNGILKFTDNGISDTNTPMKSENQFRAGLREIYVNGVRIEFVCHLSHFFRLAFFRPRPRYSTAQLCRTCVRSSGGTWRVPTDRSSVGGLSHLDTDGNRGRLRRTGSPPRNSLPMPQ